MHVAQFQWVLQCRWLLRPACLPADSSKSYRNCKLAGETTIKPQHRDPKRVKHKQRRCCCWVAKRVGPEHVLPSGMDSCANDGPATCTLAACFPCYCGGLAAAAPAHASDGDWLGVAKAECATYVESYDVNSLAIRVGISALLVVINNVLAVLLQVWCGWRCLALTQRCRPNLLCAQLSRQTGSNLIRTLCARCGRLLTMQGIVNPH